METQSRPPTDAAAEPCPLDPSNRDPGDETDAREVEDGAEPIAA